MLEMQYKNYSHFFCLACFTLFVQVFQNGTTAWTEVRPFLPSSFAIWRWSFRHLPIFYPQSLFLELLITFIALKICLQNL